MHGNEIVQYLDSPTSVTNLTKVILESSYRALQIKSKRKTLKQDFKGVEFCPTFDIQFDTTLAIFSEKLQNHAF